MSLKALLFPQKFVENYIELQLKRYYAAKQEWPDAEPFFYLGVVWGEVEASKGNAPRTIAQAAYFSMLAFDYACLKEPDNVTAMALFFLERDHPKSLRKTLGFNEAKSELMAPLLGLTQRQKQELWDINNPEQAKLKFHAD